MKSMKTLSLYFTFLLALRTLAFAAPNILTPEETAAGWKLLFDGESTSAWRGFKSEDFPKTGWTIEDGALKCADSGGRPNAGGGDIITREQFTDFEFAWEWKISPGGNGGVKYLLIKRDALARPMFRGDTGESLVGFEYQLLDNKRHPDAKNGPIRQTASLYQLVPGKGAKMRPLDQWQESRLVVRGQKIEHWLNGMKVVETELDSDELRAAIGASKYASLPGFGERKPTSILLQDHGDAIWFRNLKILSLTSTAGQIPQK